MPLNAAQREKAIELLERGEALPLDFRSLLFPPDRQEPELVYAGKEREEDVLIDTMAVPLQPIRTFGSNGTAWNNRLVFGDNLQAMATLLQMKEQGKLVNHSGSKGIKLVYIDPPFATKQEFKSNQTAERAYQDKVEGAQFIEFVRRRLIFLRELLAPDGSIFVHLDHRKAHALKLVLSEVFGESNFRNEIMLPGRASKNLQQQFETISRLNVRHDTLLWYSKSASARFSPLWIEKHKASNPEGHWHHFWSNADRPTMRYPLFGHTPKTGQWTWKEEVAKKAVANYKRFLTEGGGRTLAEYWRDTGCSLRFVRKNPEDGTPQYWRSPSEIRLADTVWAGVPIYDNSTGYPTEKNEALLAQIIELTSEPQDLVLDAFAGSGTTLAVADKLGRRWIGIDCGKLSIYTIQKRLLNLTVGKSKPLKVKPFTLYNAGLYDFSSLKQLPWEDWRFFALNLFQCRDKLHEIGGVKLDGYRGNYDVLVFDHTFKGGVVLDYGFIDDLYAQLRSKVGDTVFIIAPAASVTFLEDYIDKGNTRFYILRIPYSIINELHARDFEALSQPIDKAHVNETVDAVGFDFIRSPQVQCEYGKRQVAGQTHPVAIVKLQAFKSQAFTRGAASNGKSALSMVLVDYDYPHTPRRKGKEPPAPVELDVVFYASDIQADNWEIRLPSALLGDYTALVYIDVFGNEYTEIREKVDFGIRQKRKVNVKK